MAPQIRQPSTTPSRSKLARAQLVLGAGAAAVGLFVALHGIGLPGTRLSLEHNNRRTDSVAALQQAAHRGSRRAAVDRVAGTGRAANDRTGAPARDGGRAGKTTPRAAGKPIGSAPGKKSPGEPGAGNPLPPAGSANDSGSAESPPAKELSPSPPPSPPPPPPPPTGLLPPIDPPQLPQLPPAPPVPTVPNLPTPQVPGIPAPELPKLP